MVSTSTDITLDSSHTPALAPGAYTVDITHTRPGGGQDLRTKRALSVQAPRFTCTSADVLAVHPAPGATGDFGRTLPHLTFASPGLPWARTATGTVGGRAAPWMALLVLTAADTAAAPDPGTVALTPRTAATLIAPGPGESGVLTPAVTVSADEGQQPCHSVDLTLTAARALLPTAAELPFTAHTRNVTPTPAPKNPTGSRDGTDEDDADWSLGLHGVITANRVPRTPGPYTAVLVSLEGFEKYDLLGGTTAVPASVTTVRMAALWSWTFQATDPEKDPQASFFVLADEIAANTGLLALPTPTTCPAGEHTATRLEHGAVPVTWRLPTGQPAPAWYRGPFTPCAVPTVNGLAGVASADAATIFWKNPGIHDAGYAAAFTLGQLLALADPHLKTAQHTARREALTAVHRSLRTSQVPAGTPTTRDKGDIPPAPQGSLRALWDDTAANEQTHQTITGNLGAAWRTGEAQDDHTPAPVASGFGVPEVVAALTAHPHPPAPAAPGLSTAVTAAADAVAGVAQQHAPTMRDLLEGPGLLHRIPFHYLVPGEQMLPNGSARFFQVDAQWLATLRAGAAHAGTITGLDAHLSRSIAQHLDVLAKDPAAGCLIRSPLISAWPNLIIEAWDNQQNPITVDAAHPLPDVLMLLFPNALPHRLDLREPPHGITMGLDAYDTTHHTFSLNLRAPKDGIPGSDSQQAGGATGWEVTGIPTRTTAPDVLVLASGDTAHPGLREQITTTYTSHQLPAPEASDMALQLLNSAGCLTFKSTA
ncbi:hypothetical protein ACFVUW_11760 [Streptomyces xiamenensis]|uniref:hypothetical protein n=1 Tax=Streptomyces xiamenensis TaxID=408015 RepID=UPI0036EDC2D0